VLVFGITLWEVALLTHKKRLTLNLPLTAWFDQMISGGVSVVPITPEIAIQAYDLGEFRGDPADRIIAATAIVMKVPVVTRDAWLQSHPLLECIW
jgi:PIN domain nuclease of toxin-antitoxin system